MGLIGAFANPIQIAMSGNMLGAADEAIAGITGYSISKQNWSHLRLKRGLLPILVGGGVSMIASKSGINRQLAGIPYVKI